MGEWIHSSQWMNGCVEDPFLPQEHPSQFLSASNFYNSRGVTVGWFDSKIVIFLLQNCLGQNQLLAESLPQNGTGSPGGRMYPPHPSLARPACLSRGCPLLEKLPCRGSLQLLPHQACATRLRVHWGGRGGGFLSSSSRNSRLTSSYHD